MTRPTDVTAFLPLTSETHISTQRALPFLISIHGLVCPDCGLPMWHIDIPESLAAPEVWSDRRPGQLDPRRCASVDHVIPQVAGGSNTWGNYELVCSSCNSRRFATWRKRTGWKPTKGGSRGVLESVQ